MKINFYLGTGVFLPGAWCRSEAHGENSKFTAVPDQAARAAVGYALKHCDSAAIAHFYFTKAASTGAPGKIIDAILAAGFAITDIGLFQLDRAHAEEFYEVYKTVVSEYHVRRNIALFLIICRYR